MCGWGKRRTGSNFLVMKCQNAVNDFTQQRKKSDCTFPLSERMNRESIENSHETTTKIWHKILFYNISKVLLTNSQIKIDYSLSSLFDFQTTIGTN